MGSRKEGESYDLLAGIRLIRIGARGDPETGKAGVKIVTKAVSGGYALNVAIVEGERWKEKTEPGYKSPFLEPLRRSNLTIR